MKRFTESELRTLRTSLAEAIKAKGVSARTVCTSAGISPATYYTFIGGKSISQAAASKLAKYLGTTVGSLLTQKTMSEETPKANGNGAYVITGTDILKATYPPVPWKQSDERLDIALFLASKGHADIAKAIIRGEHLT